MNKSSIKIPTTGVKEFVEKLAAEQGVYFVRTPLDDLADTLTRLSDDEVQSDSTMDLIVALRRAKIITSVEMTLIFGRYIDEKRKDGS